MNEELFIRLCNSIIEKMEGLKKSPSDLGDIGNEIGNIVGQNICKNNEEMSIPAFEKDDFIQGFEHGYSLNNGTH